MGQVPSLKYGIIGNGRAATHLAAYLRAKKIPFHSWARSQKSPLTLQECISHSEILFVLLSDSAIEPFIESHPKIREKTLIHFSGALFTPLAHGMHPLMSFGETPYELARYEQMAFVCDEGAPEFTQIFPEFKNPHFKISPEKKPLYHALCVLSGNFTTLLWQTFFKRLEGDLGLPHEIALPYLDQIARNLAQNPDSALTGPIARGDLATIDKNMRALSGTPLQMIYASFVQNFLKPHPAENGNS